ncbi:MAG TPA: dephospho-CoA kinase [Actinotalea sp.]
MRVGLTGGIAAGKSVVAARLAELGAAVIDYDVLARQVVEPGTDGLRAVVEAFGRQVLTPDGTLDRAALGAVVFADPHARRRLDGLLHPLIRAAARQAEHDATAAGAQVVVHDIPLLAETGDADAFDAVVVVDAPVAVRVDRLVRDRGLDRAAAHARIAAQAADADRLAVADEVLDGSGSVAGLVAQVDALWSRWSAEVPS